MITDALTETRMEAVTRLLRELDGMILQHAEDLRGIRHFLSPEESKLVHALRQRVAVIERIVERERSEVAA
jgi:RNA processing factor Prp31